MFEDIYRRQMIYVPLLITSATVAGAAAAFVWGGSFAPWWYRALAVLLIIACWPFAALAVIQLREIRIELKHLKKFARANRRGPAAAPLQTARRDDDDGMGGFDIFDQRRGS